MNKMKMKFCHLILYLNMIPRYGRFYTYKGLDENGDIITEKHWMYVKNGFWGINILDRMNLFWPYLDATQPYDENGTVG